MLAENSSFKKDRLKNVDIVRVMLVKDVDSSYRMKPIKGPNDVTSVVKKFLADEDREIFIAINLDHSLKINNIHVISVGSLTQTTVHPREVFKAAILSNASHIVLAHNHPSGNPDPSDEDRLITSRLIESGRLLGIEVVDHIIVGDGKYSCLFEYEDKNGKKIHWKTQSFKDDQETN